MNMQMHNIENNGSVLIKIVAAVAAVTCAAELYYLLQDQPRDLLGGIAGLVHEKNDGLSLAKWYGSALLISSSFLFTRLMPYAFAGVVIVMLTGMYGHDFHLKAAKTFSTAKLPSVSSVADVAPVNNTTVTTATDPKAGQYYTTNTPDELTTWAIGQGYVQVKPLTKKGKGWCDEINPDTKAANKQNDEHATVNCGTGYKWNAPK